MSGPFGSSQWMYNAGDYEIANSLRINSDAASGLARFGNDSRNGNTFTISFWAKRNILGTAQILVTSKLENSGVNSFVMTFTSANKIQVLGQPEDGTTGADSNRTAILTTAVFRDTSAWYHIVYRQDTTQGTASNRHKLYVNGVLQSLSTNNALDQNTEWKYFYNANNYPYAIANDERDDAYADFYMAEHHYTDGVSNGPEAFGETGDYGEWKPIKYIGSHGTYGHYLKLNQAGAGSGTTAVGGHDYVTGSASTIGADSSGNDNHFHIQGYVTHDQMLDSPTNNFSTFNFLDNTATLSEGNLKTVNGSSYKGSRPSFAFPSSGKWYVEYCETSTRKSNVIGGWKIVEGGSNLSVNSGSTGLYWGSSGIQVANQDGNGGWHTNPNGIGSGDILSMAYDGATGKFWCGINNTYYRQNTSSPYQLLTDGNPAAGTGQTNTWAYPNEPSFLGLYNYSLTGVANFGQDSSFAGIKTAQGNQDNNARGDFFYAPPAGFLALCTDNIDDVIVPSEHFNTVLYTGDGSEEAVTGVGFQPDWVWVKARNADVNHKVFDAVRGLGSLRINTTGGENTDTSENLTSYNSDGFTIKDPDYITNTRTIVAWNWKANGVGSSNTNGSINTTKTSANVDAGFSMITYTGNGTAGATVGHGLSSAPEMIIVKNRDDTDVWMVYHAYKSSAPQTDYIILDRTDAVADLATVWNDTAPTSSVFSIGTLVDVNNNTENYIAYCFHSVEGYSKVGSYTGNGNVDGTFVYTGFRPAFIMFKNINAVGSWHMYDTKRNTSNVSSTILIANANNVEESDSSYNIDILSNGFKQRTTSSITNDGYYLYLAFAEMPFSNSNAR